MAVDVFPYDSNLPPVCDAGTHSPLRPGSFVALDGRNSFDSEGVPIVAYWWRVVSGPPVFRLGAGPGVGLRHG